jgi:hypothetical protein
MRVGRCGQAGRSIPQRPQVLPPAGSLRRVGGSHRRGYPPSADILWIVRAVVLWVRLCARSPGRDTRQTGARTRKDGARPRGSSGSTFQEYEHAAEGRSGLRAPDGAPTRGPCRTWGAVLAGQGRATLGVALQDPDAARPESLESGDFRRPARGENARQRRLKAFDRPANRCGSKSRSSRDAVQIDEARKPRSPGGDGRRTSRRPGEETGACGRFVISEVAQPSRAFRKRLASENMSTLAKM